MKLTLKWLGLAVLIGLVVFVFYVRGSGGIQGRKAPQFSLPSKTGFVSLKDYENKKWVLLNFWATWCGPCREEMPSLVRLKNKFQEEPIEILAVSVDEDGWKSIDQFAKEVPFNFPVLSDKENRVISEFGTSFLPETFLINPQGVVIEKFSGSITWDDPSMMADLKSHLSQL